MNGNRLTSSRSYSFALRGTLLGLALGVAGLTACGSDPKVATDDDDATTNSSSSSSGGGTGQGGTGQGGMGQGGIGQGGMGQGGIGQGGMGQGGIGQGGMGQGGMGQGGMGQGGMGQGGMGQGGMGQGGMGQGGMGQGGMGTTCLDDETCMTLNAVCDPQTAICDTNVQCDGVINCAAGETCLLQADMATVGACYTDCVPFAAAGCAAGESCLDLTFESTTGVCFQDGPGTAGQACTFHDINDGCVAGYTCAGDMNPVCTQRCDFWAAGGCNSLQENCSIGGFCDTAAVNPAALGQPCLNTMNQDPCALSGDVAQGLCIDAGNGLECLEWCRLNGNDCGVNQVCTGVGLNVPLGLCL